MPRCYISVSFNLEDCLGFFSFMTLTFFLSVQANYSAEVLQLGFVWCFLVIRFRLYILAGTPQKWGCVLLSAPCLEAQDGYCPIARDINFDRWMKVGSAIFLPCKLQFPPWNITILQGAMLGRYKFLLCWPSAIREHVSFFPTYLFILIWCSIIPGLTPPPQKPHSCVFLLCLHHSLSASFQA